MRPSQHNDLAQLYVIWRDAVKVTHDFLGDDAFDEIAAQIKADPFRFSYGLLQIEM